MDGIYVPKRYKGFNIVTIRQLENRPDAIEHSEGETREAGKIIDLNPEMNVKPYREPSGKFDSYTADTPYHILVNIPPMTKEVEEDGETKYRTFFTKVAAKVKLRWVSTDGRTWNKLYLFR